AFGQRRKMLRQSLRTIGRDPLPLLETAEIKPTARAEEIPVAGFIALANALAKAEAQNERSAAISSFFFSLRTKLLSPTWRVRFWRSAARMVRNSPSASCTSKLTTT